MNNSNFLINERFSISPEINLLKDLESGEETRLEPRLIQLLCLFSENSGKLMSRETLISKIWNDYGGAEDGLNQAVSFLRKALKDEKEVIETVPKKGYVLNATIKIGDGRIKEKKGLSRFKKLQMPIAIVLLLFISLLLWRGQNVPAGKELDEKARSAPQDVDEVRKVNFSELNTPEKETYLNSITTTGPDSTNYRLIAVGDKRPKFYINNQLASETTEEEYTELKDRMLRKLWERQKTYNDSMSAARRK